MEGGGGGGGGQHLTGAHGSGNTSLIVFWIFWNYLNVRVLSLAGYKDVCFCILEEIKR